MKTLISHHSVTSIKKIYEQNLLSLQIICLFKENNYNSNVLSFLFFIINQ